MRFLLDTDICSAHLKGNRLVTNRFLQHTGGQAISTITLFELSTWAQRARAPVRRQQDLTLLLNDLETLELTEAIAVRGGTIRAAALDQGVPIPELDLLIASTALEHNLTLVTHNSKNYANVPGLALADWLAP